METGVYINKAEKVALFKKVVALAKKLPNGTLKRQFFNGNPSAYRGLKDSRGISYVIADTPEDFDGLTETTCSIAGKAAVQL